ncbi:unnamed protein product [Effrenium voratum]|nr:unnamed protein product [Effrenium voratum]
MTAKGLLHGHRGGDCGKAGQLAKSHLAVWADYVEPKVPTITISDSVDIGIAEDEAQAARFREVRAKLSSDMMAMAQWNARQEENRKRAHVISVLHEKSQVETGKKLLVSLSSKAARVPRTWRVVTVVTVIEFLFFCQVSPLDVRLILYVDCTKFGVMTQKEVNDVADTVEKHLNYGPGGGIAVILPPLLSGSTSGGSLRQDWRRIEDKMAAKKVELRQFTLNLDLSELHRNRELPAAYLCFLGVQDHALPMKGTAHRAVKGVPTSGQDGVKANSLPGIDLLPNFKACLRGMSNALTSNLRFCASPLWQKQALAVKDFPFAIQEKDFIIPGDSLLHSNDQRRNLTDFQETAQWLGGVGVPKAIFKSLLGGLGWALSGPLAWQGWALSGSLAGQVQWQGLLALVGLLSGPRSALLCLLSLALLQLVLLLLMLFLLFACQAVGQAVGQQAVGQGEKLLHGPPGTGKTSTITAVAKTMYKQRYKSMTLEMNASDARGIDVVREQIKTFVSVKQLFASAEGQPKLVILDEADNMTSSAQFALRRMIEQYASNCRFILICNYSSKIIPALQSRCTKLRFAPLTEEQMLGRLQYIAETEKIQLTQDGAKAIVQVGGGDMRKVINIFQTTSMGHRGNVDSKAVYASTGIPSPEEIQHFLRALLNGSVSFAASLTSLKHMLNAKGYALDDFLQLMHKQLLLEDLPVSQRLQLTVALADIDWRLKQGCGDAIQLGAIIGIFHEARAMGGA